MIINLALKDLKSGKFFVNGDNMKNILLFCLILSGLSGCVYDVGNCECENECNECSETIKIVSDPKEESVLIPSKDEDPDVCENSNKTISGCYMVPYVPSKDDPRPERNLFDSKIKIIKQTK